MVVKELTSDWWWIIMTMTKDGGGFKHRSLGVVEGAEYEEKNLFLSQEPLCQSLKSTAVRGHGLHNG